MKRILPFLFAGILICTFACKSGKSEQQKTYEAPAESYPKLIGDYSCNLVDPAPDLREFDLYKSTKSIRIYRYSREISFRRQTQEMEDFLKEIDEGILEKDPDCSLTTLTELSQAKLFNIIYRYRKGGRPHGLCYLPRHLILFDNMFGKRVAYLELCFKCSRVETDLPELEIQCGKQWEEYADLFTLLGIAP